MAKLRMRVDFPVRRGQNGTVIPADSITVVDLPPWWPEEWLDWALASMPPATRDGTMLRAVLGLPGGGALAARAIDSLQRRAIELALWKVIDLIEAEACAPEAAVARIRRRIGPSKPSARRSAP